MEIVDGYDPAACQLCGEPLDGHDDASCELILMAWKPLGLLGSTPNPNDDGPAS